MLYRRRASLTGESPRRKEARINQSVRVLLGHPVMNQHTVSLLPSTAGTEAQTNPGGPGSPLEEQNREDDTEGETEGGTDDEGRDGAVPLYCVKEDPQD